MYFAKVLAALAASTIIAAQVVLTNSDYSGITIGVPFEITWAGNTGAVKLLLKNGPSDNQALVGTIAEGLTGNSFNWTPQGPAGTYNIEIQDTAPGGAVNYSPEFQVVVGGILPVPTASSQATYPELSPTASETVSTSEPVLTIQTSTNYDVSTEVKATSVVVSSSSYETPTVVETTVEVTPSYVQPVQPPLSTGPVYAGNATTSVVYGNATVSSVIYGNSTIASFSTVDTGVAPTKTSSVSPIPTSAIVPAMAAHASPMAAMLLGLGGLAFLL